MALLRFDSTSDRGPSAQIWAGVVDWVRGSLATALGQRDFEDFAPFNADSTDVAGSAGVAGALDTTQRFGVLSVTANAGTDARAAAAREIWYTLQDSPILVFETRIDQNADADDPQVFAGFFDGADFDDVFADGAIADSGNQDAIGLLWNADETIDIVAVDDGTLTVIKDNIGVTVERTDGYVKLGLRIERPTTTTVRLVPCVNGVIARSGITVVASTVVPENPMRPGVATTVAATTAPDVDVDFIYSADK